MRSIPWDRPETVAGFVASSPNAILMAWIQKRSLGQALNILDIGCGAGRNAMPLAALGHKVTGIDRSLPMLEAARDRAQSEGLAEKCNFMEGAMEDLKVPPGFFDIVIAHGIWNLAESDDQLTKAMSEAGRAARPGAGLFVFTFSRNTLGSEILPLDGQKYIFDRFSGMSQSFLTEEELDQLLNLSGFTRENPGHLREYNRTRELGPQETSSRPIIWEGTWIKR